MAKIIKTKITKNINEKDYFCVCCTEPYSNSKAKEKWVQCLKCKAWAHEACTGGKLSYVCHNCGSE